MQHKKLKPIIQLKENFKRNATKYRCKLQNLQSIELDK